MPKGEKFKRNLSHLHGVPTRRTFVPKFKKKTKGQTRFKGKTLTRTNERTNEKPSQTSGNKNDEKFSGKRHRKLSLSFTIAYGSQVNAHTHRQRNIYFCKYVCQETMELQNVSCAKVDFVSNYKAKDFYGRG